MLRQILNLFRLGQTTATVRLADQLSTMEREQDTYLLASETIDAADVLVAHPPRVEHVKKKFLFDLALTPPSTGSVTVCRYSEIPFPRVFQPLTPETEVVAKKGYMNYIDSDAVDHWYMNLYRSLDGISEANSEIVSGARQQWCVDSVNPI